MKISPHTPKLPWALDKIISCGLVAKLCHFCDPMSCSSPLFCPWDFPGKNTGVSCHLLLQCIFLTQGLNLHLLLGKWILYHRSIWEAPKIMCALLLKPSSRLLANASRQCLLLVPVSFPTSLLALRNFPYFLANLAMHWIKKFVMTEPAFLGVFVARVSLNPWRIWL